MVGADGWRLAIATMAQERVAIGNYGHNDRGVALRALAATPGRGRGGIVIFGSGAGLGRRAQHGGLRATKAFDMVFAAAL